MVLLLFNRLNAILSQLTLVAVTTYLGDLKPIHEMKWNEGANYFYTWTSTWIKWKFIEGYIINCLLLSNIFVMFTKIPHYIQSFLWLPYMRIDFLNFLTETKHYAESSRTIHNPQSNCAIRIKQPKDNRTMIDSEAEVTAVSTHTPHNVLHANDVINMRTLQGSVSVQ